MLAMLHATLLMWRGGFIQLVSTIHPLVEPEVNNIRDD